MTRDILHADLHEVLERHAQTDGLHDARRACLKLHRRIVVDHGILRDLFDHVATAYEWTHFLHAVSFDIDRAGPRRPIELVPRDRIEITAQIFDIDRHMDRALRAIHQHWHATRMGLGRDGFHIHHGTKNVGTLRDRHQLGLVRDYVDHALRIQTAVIGNIDPFQHNAHTFTQEMPGHDIGMVLHYGQNDLVARAQMLHRPAIGHEVDALCGARVQNDLVWVFDIEEFGNGAAHGLILFGREVGQIVQPAVHIGVFLGVAAGHRINHHLRLLRRGAIVQIGQRFPVHLAREDRKVLADFVDIKHASVQLNADKGGHEQ